MKNAADGKESAKLRHTVILQFRLIIHFKSYMEAEEIISDFLK